MQWQDEFRFFPPAEAIANATSKAERYRLIGGDLGDDSHITAEYLHLRFEAFFDTVIKEEVQVFDNSWPAFFIT